jgi:prostaglandin-endoperoxide synthase 2
MAVEFTLVYRWHMLIPDKLTLAGKSVDSFATLWNTSMITDRGLGALFEDASRQPAGKVGLFNSPRFLHDIEARSIQMGRDLHLASYNDYRAAYQFPRITSFSEISSNPAVQSELERLYGNVDRIDYYVGLFAEDTVPNSVLSPLIGTLVAIDAFSQALTNPLLNPNIYHERAFSPLGMELIEKTRRLTDVLHRNIPADSRQYYVSLTREDWKRL